MAGSAAPPWEIGPFGVEHIDKVLELWKQTEGLGVGPGDSPEAIGRFLERNPGLSLVARDGEAIVAAVLCGHDGRRGLIYHLAVARSRRRGGLAAELARRCFEGLAAQGIGRCLILVQEDNAAAREFWRAIGARFRTDLVAFSKDLP